MSKKQTQAEKLFEVMCKGTAEGKIWFTPQDFMRNDLGDMFVGYEASARFSELASDYPVFIESERQGKYVARRLRIENIVPFFDDLSLDYQDIIYKYNLYRRQ